MYRLMGLGTLDNLLYVNPFADPVEFASRALVNMPLLWLGSFSSLPLMTTFFFSDWTTWLAILGAGLFAAWLVALLPLGRNRFLIWALAAYLLMLLPQLCTDASERGLYVAMIPGAVLLTAVAGHIAPLARRGARLGESSSRWLRVMGWVAVVGVLLPGLVQSLLYPFMYAESFGRPVRELRSAYVQVLDRRPEHTILLNTSGMMLTLYTWDIMNSFSDAPLDIWTLSSANGRFSLKRVGEKSFAIKTDRSGWLSNIFARLFRVNKELRAGRRYETPLFTATLLELSGSARDVYEVEFEFADDLDSESLLFLKWNGRSFEPVDIDSLEPGEEIELADTSDLWRSMM
jgi:hypothetical protein